jgi:Protein of unknown function (DUF4232)
VTLRFAEQRSRDRLITRAVALVLSFLAVASCSGGTSSVSSRSTSTTGVTVAASTTIPSAPGVSECAPDVVIASFGFLGTSQDSLGGIIITNAGAVACSLQGQPVVRLIDSRGDVLATEERAGSRAPDQKPPQAPVVLTPNRGSEAGVLLDWHGWCGASPGAISVQLRFAPWSAPVSAVPAVGADPTVTPPCSPGSGSILVVDVVRVHDATGYHNP